MGIGPTYSAWEADVLPLNYTRMFVKLSIAQVTAKIKQKICHFELRLLPVFKMAYAIISNNSAD